MTEEKYFRILASKLAIGSFAKGPVWIKGREYRVEDFPEQIIKKLRRVKYDKGGDTLPAVEFYEISKAKKKGVKENA